MSANPLFNAVSKRKPNETRYLQDVNNHTRLTNGKYTSSRRKPSEYDRDYGSSTRSDGAMEPPDKRRRVADGRHHLPSPDPENWDDDDFTQADLENIDSIITHSQHVKPSGGGGGGDDAQGVRNMPGYCRSPRAVGRGAVKSLSAGEVGSYLPGNRLTYGGTDSRDGQKSTYSSRYTSGLGTSVASSYPSSSKNTFQHESKSSCQTPSTIGSGAVPTAHKGEFTNVQRNEVEKLKEDLEFYRKEHGKLRTSQLSKDGQISMLRRSLQEKEADIASMHQERVQYLDEQARQRSEKEKALEKEMERLQTQLQFKEHEIVELQGTCRKLEQKSRSTGSSGSESPRRTHSPRRVPPRSPQIPRSPRAGSSSTSMSPPSVKGGFPTQQSFNAHNIDRKSSSSSRASSEQITSGDSAVSRTLSLGVDVVGSKGIARTQKMKLPVSVCVGSTSGSYILSKMMRASPPPVLESSAVTPCGIMGLLQHPPSSVDPSSLRLQRDSSGQTFSPSRPKRPTPSSGSSVVSASLPLGSVVSLSSSAVCQQVVTSEHYTLATQSLSWLLAEDMEGSCESAVLLLPLIEDYVSAYLTLVTSALDSHPSSQPASLTSYGSVESSSIDSLSSSMAGCLIEGAARANQLEAATLNALRTLHSLVNYSQHTAQALVCDNYAELVAEVRRSQEERQKENGVRPQPSDGRQSAPLTQPAARPAASLSDLSCGPGHLDISVTRVTRDLQLLHKVILTANPLLPNGQAARASLVEVSLQVLCRVASVCAPAAAHGFGALFSQDVLLNCFSDKDCVSVPCFLPVRECAMDMLTVLVRHEVMLTKLCSQSDDCVLLAMYNVVVTPLEGKPAYKLRLILKVLGFLSQMLSYHKSGHSLLLEADCHCSVEVVKCVILMLITVLHEHRRSSSDESLLALRQGSLLLVVLAQKDKLYQHHRLEVEHDYVELVCGMDEIFRENPLVNRHEVAAVRDLWDFDQDYPESCESDETTMEDGS